MPELENKVKAALRVLDKFQPLYIVYREENDIKKRKLDRDTILNDPQKSLTLLGLVEGSLCRVSSSREHQLRDSLRHYHPLPVREVLATRYHYGLVDGEKHTLKEVGKFIAPLSNKESLSQKMVQTLLNRTVRGFEWLLFDDQLPQLTNFFRENSIAA